MRNLQLRKYQRGDELSIEPVEEMSRKLRHLPEYKAEFEKQVTPDNAWTGLCDGIILCLGWILDNGVMCIMLDQNAVNKKIAVMRLFRQGFELMKNRNGFDRLLTYVLKENDKKEGIFARHFGFKVSGEKKFGDFTYIEYIWQRQ